jgi:hypothetical protein
MKTILIPVTLCLFLVACMSGSSNLKNDKSADSAAGNTPVFTDTLPYTVIDEGVGGDDENGCVFDTSTHKFTTTALKKFDPSIRYTWDSVNSHYVVALDGNDSLSLQIGGCNHFGYEAVYYTDSSRYEDEAFIVGKAKWMAQNFFSAGFDETYVACISKGLYKKENGADPGMKVYSIINPDTNTIDHVYEGWLVQKYGARTKISLIGYVN